MEYQRAPLASLVFAAEATFDDSILAALAQGIKEAGQPVMPIVVVPAGYDSDTFELRFRVVANAASAAAARLANLENVAVWVTNEAELPGIAKQFSALFN